MTAWSDDLLTGIQEIDQQHMILFECLERLQRSITDDEKWSAVHYGLIELSDFARIHFSVEEALMRLHGYPETEKHCAEHRNFVKVLGKFKTDSVRMDVSGEMGGFLNDWLVKHIAHSDHAYVPHLRHSPLAPRGPIPLYVPVTD